MAKKKRRLKRKQRIRLALFCTVVIAFIILLMFLLSLAFCNHKTASEQKTEEQKQEISLPVGYDYVTRTSADIRRGDLILVNDIYNYAFLYNQDVNFVSLAQTKFRYMHIQNTDMMLNKDASDALYNLVSDFYDKTKITDLNIISADRTYKEQEKILEERIKSEGLEDALKYVARPGFSEHNCGLAIDFAIYKEDGSWGTFYGKYDYQWIADNAYKYGFILRYPKDKTEITKMAYESWHYRFIGIPHSYYIYKNGLCFEEYIDLLKTTSFDNRLNIQIENGNYEVWYTSELKFLVPTDREYQISGNNADGFIITVKN